jgi:glycosyltransferase involved in cell wall biosynthesis
VADEPVRGRVSVILATRNRADRVGRAIESVLSQRDVDLELILVNDASEDDTAAVLAGWCGDDRVRVVENARRRGLPASLNRGLSRARGEFIARIDDDDVWNDPDKLAEQLAWMRRHPDTVLLGTGYVDEWGRETRNPADDEAIRRQMLMRCPFCHSSVLFTAAAVRAAGGYDETLDYAEDWELWMRLGTRGRLANLERICLVKSAGEDTLSARHFDRQLRSAGALSARHAAHYPGRHRARALHAFNRWFFSVFPAGGKVHGLMGGAFRRVFGLGREDAGRGA